MSEPQEPTRAAAIDYATPRDAPPRPGATLWIAAGIVWAACVPVLWFAALILRRAMEDASPYAFFWAAFVGGLGAGLALAEWAGVARRDEACVAVVFYAASLISCFVLLGGVLALIGLSLGGFPRGELTAVFAFALGLPACVILVAVAHGRWLNQLRQHTAEAGR